MTDKESDSSSFRHSSTILKIPWTSRRKILQTAAAGVLGSVAVSQHGAAQEITPGNEEWSFETDDWIRSSPTVVDQTVYVGGWDGTLYALGTTDGAEVWTFETGGNIWSSPTVVDETVYVNSGNGLLYAVDATNGEQEWSAEINGLMSSPTVANGTVYVGSQDNVLYALDATNGDELWGFEAGDWIRSSPTVVDETVFVGSEDGSLYAIDTTDGNEKWSFNIDRPVRSSPTVAHGTVYVGSFDDESSNSLYAVNATSGEQEWRFETGARVWSSPTVADGIVYVGSFDNSLYAIDTTDGNEIWAFEMDQSAYSSPTVVGETVFVGSQNNSLYAIDTTDGEEIWTFETADDIRSSPIVVDGTLFVGSFDNSLYAIAADVNGSSDGSRVSLGTLGHHHEWVKAQSDDSSDDAPVKIEDWHDLNAIRDDLGGEYVLVNDLDAETDGYDDYIGDPSEGWDPIGEFDHEFDHEFTGTFDGQNNEIDGLTVDRPEEEHVGLFGANDGSITNVKLAGVDIVGNGQVGSLIGFNWTDGKVEEISVSGEVTGEWRVGGIVGSHWGELLDSDASCDVAGQEAVGGIVGFNDGEIGNSHYSLEEVNINDQQQLTIGGLFADQFDDWLSNDKDLNIDEYPSLAQTGGVVEITSIQAVRDALGFIDNSDQAWRLQEDLELIDDAADLYFPYFAGSFDGNGHTITVELTLPHVAGVGFVGHNMGTISSLVVDGSITGDRFVGGLVGRNFNKVTEASASADVQGDYRVGGLVGRLLGQVRKSSASAEVNGGDDVGGLVGFSSGEVKRAWASGDVSGEDAVGGLVGGIWQNSSVERAWASGDVSGEDAVGGLIGENEGEVLTAYWDKEASGHSEAIGVENGTSDITVLTTAEMQGKEAEQNMDALDFEETWDIVTDPDDYPILQWPHIDSAVFTVEIVRPADGAEVTEDEPLDVDVEVTNTGGNEAEKTIELTAPAQANIDVEVVGGATDIVNFEIPGGEINGVVEITVESPDDTDQVSVTAVDPCFIATAAYDTPAAEEIDVLRDFRDDVLRQNTLGRLFIKTYYWGSPPIARWIRRNSTRRELVKQYFVEPLVRIVQTPSNIRKDK